MSGSAVSMLIILVPGYGAACLAMLWHAAPGAFGLLAPVLAVPLIWLSVTDLRRFEIPDTATIIIALCGLLIQWLTRPAGIWIEIGLAIALTAGLWIAGGIFFRRTGREGLGIGDAKLVGAGSLCTGFEAIWWALLVASLGGIAAALTARHVEGRARRRGGAMDGPGNGGATETREAESGIPFGPFLAYSIYMVFLLQFPGMPWH